MDSVGSSDAGRDLALPGDTSAGPGSYYPAMFVRGRSLQPSSNQEHTMKDFEKQITELKKENFNLKLRIYFLEEQIQRTCCAAGRDDVHRLNVELKVEVESMKYELDEKQRLLLKASKAVESLTGGGGKIRHERGRDGDKEATEFLNRKIRDLERELETRSSEVEKIGALLEQERIQRFDAEEKLSAEEERYAKVAAALAEKDWAIGHLNGTLASKAALIADLRQQLTAKPTSEGDPESRDRSATARGEEPEDKEPDRGKDSSAVNGERQPDRQLSVQLMSEDSPGRQGLFTKGKKTNANEPAFGQVVPLKGESQPDQEPTSDDRSESPDSLDVTEGRETEEEELDYRQLLSSLKGEKERCSLVIKSMQENRNPEKDLDAFAELRRQLLENIQANQELSKILEGLIRAHCPYNDTMSFLGDQTSYLSICLDHLNQNVNYACKESQDNPLKVDFKDHLARTHGSSYQYQAVNKETMDVGDGSRATQVGQHNLDLFGQEDNDSFNHSRTLVDSRSECTLTPQRVTFSELNTSYRKFDVLTQSIGIQVDVKETPGVLPTSNSQVDGSSNVYERKENGLLLDIGKNDEYSASGQLSHTERTSHQSERKVYKIAKKSRLPVPLKSTCAQPRATAKSPGPSVQDDLKLQEELQRYRGQVDKLTEDLHYAYTEIQKYKNEQVLLKDDSIGEQHSDYSAGGSSHTPSRLVPGYRLWSDKNGRHVLGLLEDYDALQKQIVEGMSMLHELKICFDDGVVLKATGDFGSVIYEKNRRAMQSLEEALRLMNLLWRVSLPPQVSEPRGPCKDEETRLENGRLIHINTYEQNQFSSGVTNRFYSDNHLEDSMKLILQQVSLTHDVLRKARRNLERQPANTHH